MKYIILISTLLLTPWALAQIDNLPEPLKLLTEQGGEIVGQFDAPAGMKGYVADLRGQVATLYITADDQYMFTGAMLDAKGNNLGEQAVQAYVIGPKSEKDWKQLESSHWVADGSPTAKQIVYTFTDTNCPYCKKFWQSARPWVESGQVQLRHILVGIIKEDSLGQAAAIMAADNPAKILEKHQAGTLFPKLKPLQEPSPEISNQLMVNHQSMMALGVSATPATFYRDTTGAVKKQMGLPPESSLNKIFGPLKGKQFYFINKGLYRPNEYAREFDK